MSLKTIADTIGAKISIYLYGDVPLYNKNRFC